MPSSTALVPHGENSRYQLGFDGPHTNSMEFVPGANLAGVIALTAGGNFTCARLSNGSVTCWGANDHGELGDGTLDDAPPGGLVKVNDASDIDAGHTHACAVSHDTVHCWGDDSYNQVGAGTGSSDPQLVVWPSPERTRDPPLVVQREVAQGELTMTRAGLTALLVASVLSVGAAATSNAQGPADIMLARELANNGLGAYNEGDYETAANQLSAAWELAEITPWVGVESLGVSGRF